MDTEGGAARAKHRLGKYELLEEVGRGGMGVVYRAFDHSLQRMVAVKVLRDKLLNHPLLISRFQREAKAAASLNHPSIVQIYSVGWLDDVLHIAMEFIEGASLAKLMQDQRRIAWKHALDFGRQVASALACAHEAHVIHRDIKLTNILIDPHGRAYVTDFGIAKVLTADTQLTVRGERLGTPQYMAPELFSGGDVTPSSDLYSLGVVLFQLISGRLPYEAESQVGLIKKIASEPPARLRDYVPSVPEDVERLVAYLIEKRPKDRPKSAEEVRDAIERVRAGKPLDEGPAYAPSALAEFRESLAKMTRKAATPAPQQRTPASGRLQATTTRWGQKWAAVPKWIRLSLLGGVLLLAAVGIVIAGIAGLRGSDALAAIAEANGEVGRWRQSVAVADFVKAMQDEVTATVNLDDFEVHRGAWKGGTLEVELRGVEGSRRQGQYAVCSLAPGAGEAWLSVAPRVGGSSDGRMPAARNLDGTQDDAWHALLAEEGPPILALSVSRDGRKAAILRESGAEEVRLWMASRGHGEVEQTLLTEGKVTLGRDGLSPDGETVAVGMRDGRGDSQLYVLDAADGAVLAELGDGWEAQWEPSGEGLIVAANDEKDLCQLWSVPADALGSRVRLTYFERGCARAFSLSGDGKWAAVARRAEGKPQVTFVRLLGGH